jgi:lipopolysaccharide export LptBFGC system permease protein LptF
MTVLSRSCLREAGANFLFYASAYLGLIALMFCVPLLKQGAPLMAVLAFLPENLVIISMLALPLAMVTALLSTVGRMREDGEITALMAAGVSTWRIAAALLPLAAGLALALGLAMHLLLPSVALRLLQDRLVLVQQAAPTQVSRHLPLVQEGNDIIAAVGVDGSNLEHLFGVRMTPDANGGFGPNSGITVCYAPSARFVTDPQVLDKGQKAAFELHGAWLLRRDANGGATPNVLTATLPLYALSVPNTGGITSEADTCSTYTLWVLMARTADTEKNRGYLRNIERAWHLRWMVPVAVLAYWAFACGLALGMGSANRLLAVVIGALVVVATLVPSFSVVRDMAPRIHMNAGWIMWPPILILGGVGVWLLWKRR